MAYVYGERISAKVTPLIESLRKELYTQVRESVCRERETTCLNCDKHVLSLTSLAAFFRIRTLLISCLVFARESAWRRRTSLHILRICFRMSASLFAS